MVEDLFVVNLWKRSAGKWIAEAIQTWESPIEMHVSAPIHFMGTNERRGIGYR